MMSGRAVHQAGENAGGAGRSRRAILGAVALASLVKDLFGEDLPVAIDLPDGSSVGPAGAPARVVVRSRAGLRHVVWAPGELGFARAYVGGHIDVEGDIYAALALGDLNVNLRLSPRQIAALARSIGPAVLIRPRRPREEARLRGRLHSKERDAAAVSHHYDVSNRFYGIVLGPSMTYSCAVYHDPSWSLEQAQEAKHDLICRKLALKRTDRLLDIGCGWGSMILHATSRYGVDATGVTLSVRQAELARARATDSGNGRRIDIRVSDYRDVDDGPYDAVSSIGMFEHVGLSQLETYFGRVFSLLPRGGRFLNHAISRPRPGDPPRLARRGFVDRYVFPDGELHEVGTVVSAMHAAGFEVRHVETLREHYGVTLRAWVANLEKGWDEAVADAGEARARIWRLYMAGAARNFEANRTQVHQVLAVKP